MNNDAIQHQRPSPDGAHEHLAQPLQLLQVGSFRFGIFADDIAAIAEWREPTALPHAPNSVLGVVSIQGRILTVIDVARLPGCEVASTDGSARHLIALRGDEQLALVVDEVGEIVELVDADFEKTKDSKETLILGVLHREGTAIYILNLKELFPTAIQGRERRRRRF